MLFPFNSAFWRISHAALAPTELVFSPLRRQKRGRKKKVRQRFFDLKCRVCFISFTPLHLDFPFQWLAPSVHSNHHLGKPDKLRGRHQHLGSELKSFLETASRLTTPMLSLLNMEEKDETHISAYFLLPFFFMCLFVYMFVSEPFGFPLHPCSWKVYGCTFSKAKRFTLGTDLEECVIQQVWEIIPTPPANVLQSEEFSSPEAIIKQSSYLFIWSLNPDIINTRAQLSKAGIHVSKLLVTSFLLKSLMDWISGIRSLKICVWHA